MMLLSRSDTTEHDSFFDANHDINFVQLFLTTQSGVPRGKNIPRKDARRIYEDARYLPGTILTTDITGRDIDSPPFSWLDGDGDRLALPVMGRLTRAPWLGPDFAQLMLSMYELDGAAFECDPRHVLQRVLDRFGDISLTPVVACELEFYLVPLGERLQSRRYHGTKHTEIYGLLPLDDSGEFLRDVYSTAAAIGLELEAAVSENSLDQFEIGLRHRPNALQACDDAVVFKRLIKGIARRHGFDAVFMAKPYTDRAGSGLHLHLSCNDAVGRNVFDPTLENGRLQLLHAIGGVLALAKESMSIFAPNANSYRRLRPFSFAPTTATWGDNNRTVAVRVPSGPQASTRLEHRICGADANPYLATAAVLAGMHHGIVSSVQPGSPCSGNAYSVTMNDGTALPTNWLDALALFRRSTILSDYLGPSFHSTFDLLKTSELDRYSSQVTQQDYDWYWNAA